MKKLAFLFSFFALSFAVIAQDDPKTLHQTARGFMAQADWDNAILVLNRLLQADKNNLEYNKDMVQCYYFKRDYEKAVEGVKTIVNRDDADVMTFQLAGNVYKALEDPKECEKVYKAGLKNFRRAALFIVSMVNYYGKRKTTAQLIFGKKELKLIRLSAAIITMQLFIIFIPKTKYGVLSMAKFL